MAEPEPEGDWRRITYDAVIEVTDWTALAAAAFDRVEDPVTGEVSMVDYALPEMQLQGYLTRVLGQALELVGERAGFRWRMVASTRVQTTDETGNFPSSWLPPQPGPNGIPLFEAYPEAGPCVRHGSNGTPR